MTINPKKEKKNFLSKNLSYLLNQHSLDIKDLSIETGLAITTIARLRKDGTNPTIASLEPLLEFFRLSIDDFLYEDLSSPNYSKRKKMGDLVPISIYSLDEITYGMKNAKVLKFIAAAGITRENVFGILINGDVLAPAFQSNSIIIIDPNLKPVEGDYVLCKLGNKEIDSPVFRQIFIDGDDYYFKSVNPGFTELKNYENYKIIGVVIKSIESYR